MLGSVAATAVVPAVLLLATTGAAAAAAVPAVCADERCAAVAAVDGEDENGGYLAPRVDDAVGGGGDEDAPEASFLQRWATHRFGGGADRLGGAAGQSPRPRKEEALLLLPHWDQDQTPEHRDRGGGAASGLAPTPPLLPATAAPPALAAPAPRRRGQPVALLDVLLLEPASMAAVRGHALRACAFVMILVVLHEAYVLRADRQPLPWYSGPSGARRGLLALSALSSVDLSVVVPGSYGLGVAMDASASASGLLASASFLPLLVSVVAATFLFKVCPQRSCRLVAILASAALAVMALLYCFVLESGMPRAPATFWLLVLLRAVGGLLRVSHDIVRLMAFRATQKTAMTSLSVAQNAAQNLGLFLGPVLSSVVLRRTVGAAGEEWTEEGLTPEAEAAAPMYAVAALWSSVTLLLCMALPLDLEEPRPAPALAAVAAAPAARLPLSDASTPTTGSSWASASAPSPAAAAAAAPAQAPAAEVAAPSMEPAEPWEPPPLPLSARKAIFMCGLLYTFERGLSCSAIFGATAMMLELFADWTTQQVGYAIGINFLLTAALAVAFVIIRGKGLVQDVPVMIATAVVAAAGTVMLFDYRGDGGGPWLLLVADGVVYPCAFIANGIVNGIAARCCGAIGDPSSSSASSSSWCTGANYLMMSSVMLSLGAAAGAPAARFLLDAHGRNAYASAALAVAVFGGGIVLKVARLSAAVGGVGAESGECKEGGGAAAAGAAADAAKKPAG